MLKTLYLKLEGIDLLQILVFVIRLKLLLFVQLLDLDFKLLNLRGALHLNFGQIDLHLLLLVFEVINLIVLLLDVLLKLDLLLLKLMVSVRNVLSVVLQQLLLFF